MCNFGNQIPLLRVSILGTFFCYFFNDISELIFKVFFKNNNNVWPLKSLLGLLSGQMMTK